MKDYNKVIITGNIFETPILNKTKRKISVTTFNIYKLKKINLDKIVKMFYTCVAWGAIAEKICSEFIADDSIKIEGVLENKKYVDKYAIKRVINEIIVTSFEKNNE